MPDAPGIDGREQDAVHRHTSLAGSVCQNWLEDIHSIAMSGGDISRLTVPAYIRRITVSEAAALQGFPKSFRFCGSRCEQYRQIGNAVPVKLGEAIARTIIADMKGEPLRVIPGFPYSRYKNTNEITWNKQMQVALKRVAESRKPPVSKTQLNDDGQLRLY